MTKYFLKTVTPTIPCRFDRVDKKVYQMWDKAVDRDGNPLYTGVGFEYADEGPKLKGNPSWSDFDVIVRIMGRRIPDGSVPGGFIREPDIIRLVVKGKKQLHEIDHTQD